MKIAILSGKGGTGKTTVSTNFAFSLKKSLKEVKLIDLDAEEPNAHLFFDIEFTKQIDVNILIPKVDNAICAHCGKCSQACQFNAIITSPKTTITFDYLCHACGACSIVCDPKAIKEVPKNIGMIKVGKTKEGISFVQSIMNIKESSPVRIIRQAKKLTDDDKINILDCPPGVSCPTVESIQDVDFALLVTEPTPFGLHDLKLAITMVKQFNLPLGVIINRYDKGFYDLEDYLNQNSIPLVMKIPFDRQIAKNYSRGDLFIKDSLLYQNAFTQIYEKIMEIVR